jgi:hypothetical protein
MGNWEADFWFARQNEAARAADAAAVYAPPPGATLENYRSDGVGFRVARNVD